MDVGSSQPRMAMHVTMPNIAAAAVTILAVQSANFDTGAVTSPARPRAAQCVFASTWNGGDIEFTGVDVAGEVATDVIIAVGTGTVVGVVPFATISRVRNLGNRTTGTCTIQTSTKIGIPCKRGQLLTVQKSLIADAGEAVGTVDYANSTIIFTTVPNGTGDYEVYFSQRISIGD